MKARMGEFEKLKRRQKKIMESLAPLDEIVRGSLFERKLKCGKPYCHCAQGKGHPVTYLSVTLRGGRTVQITVPPPLRPRLRRWVKNYADWWQAMERICEINRRVLRKRLFPSGKKTKRSG